VLEAAGWRSRFGGFARGLMLVPAAGVATEEWTPEASLVVTEAEAAALHGSGGAKCDSEKPQQAATCTNHGTVHEYTYSEA
jgi:hypothetical protein